MIVKRISASVAFILSLYGLYELVEKIYVSSGSSISTVIIVGLILLTVFTYHFIEYLNRPFVFRYYGISQSKDRVVKKGNQILKVDKDGLLEVDTYRTYIFLKTPQMGDLNDTIMINKEFKEDSISDFYKSKNSSFNGYKKKGKNRLVLNWKPKKEFPINVFEDYEHHYKWYPPGINFNSDKNYFLFNGLYPQVNFQADLKTNKDINKFWVIEKPKFRPFLNVKRIEKIIKKKKNFMVSQPQRISPDHITWKLAGSERASSYVLYWTYENKASKKKKSKGNK